MREYRTLFFTIFTEYLNALEKSDQGQRMSSLLK